MAILTDIDKPIVEKLTVTGIIEDGAMMIEQLTAEKYELCHGVIDLFNAGHARNWTEYNEAWKKLDAIMDKHRPMIYG